MYLVSRITLCANAPMVKKLRLTGAKPIVRRIIALSNGYDTVPANLKSAPSRARRSLQSARLKCRRRHDERPQVRPLMPRVVAEQIDAVVPNLDSADHRAAVRQVGSR